MSEDERLLEEFLVDEDFQDMSGPVTGLDLLLLLSGGTPRAGIYRSEFERAGGSVFVETRVVNRHGHTLRHEIAPKPPAAGKKKQGAKTRR
jgi:hypothetical protein